MYSMEDLRGWDQGQCGDHRCQTWMEAAHEMHCMSALVGACPGHYGASYCDHDMQCPL